VRILFVCLGNICRSPTAEGVMRGLIAQSGLDGEVGVESAGTGDWHVGHPPDPRSVSAAAERGIELEGEARQVGPEDFERFDLLVAMDQANRDDLLRLAPDEEARAKVRLLRELGEGLEEDVPDPYYGGEEGFTEVVEIIDRNCRALIGQLE
jgi:protein-tyrosine phosphatase